jgi:hypothetical protein
MRDYDASVFPENTSKHFLKQFDGIDSTLLSETSFEVDHNWEKFDVRCFTFDRSHDVIDVVGIHFTTAIEARNVHQANLTAISNQTGGKNM